MLLVQKGAAFHVVMETISYISLCCVTIHYYSLNSFSTKEANCCLCTYVLTKGRRDTPQRRLSVTNLSSENNLPTFQLNAPVVIREVVRKCERNTAIYSYALLRIHIIGGQRFVTIAPPSLPPHHSTLATRDFQLL